MTLPLAPPPPPLLPVAATMADRFVSARSTTARRSVPTLHPLSTSRPATAVRPSNRRARASPAMAAHCLATPALREVSSGGASVRRVRAVMKKVNRGDSHGWTNGGGEGEMPPPPTVGGEHVRADGPATTCGSSSLPEALVVRTR